MEENKTLEQLNQEYVNLVSTVTGLRQNLTELESRKNEAEENLERAEADAKSKRELYERLSAYAELAPEGYSEELLARNREEVEKARQEMEAAAALVSQRETEALERIEAFETLEDKVKQADNRMNVILVSFGADENIHDALVNEIEVSYQDKIDERNAAQQALDQIKTKVNDDQRIQDSVAQLAQLLEQFENAKLTVTPDNMKKLDDLASQIKKTRNSVRSRMRSLGVKGGKISSEEIDAMTTERDSKGRFVIAELNRQIQDLDVEIGTLSAERNAILETMAVSKEMAENLENGTPEYQRLSQDVAELSAELSEAAEQRDASKARLDEIPEKRAQLQKELEDLIGSDANAAIIAQLQQELDAIKREDVPEIDNPRVAELMAEIDELEKEGGNGAAVIPNPEYEEAERERDEAKEALEEESKNLNPESSKYFQAGDIIEDNFDYTMAKNDVEIAVENLESFDESIKSNSELVALKDSLEAATGELGEADRAFAEAERALNDKEKEIDGKYISEDRYEDLKNPDSNLSKAFSDYEKAELAVREAMLALLKEPSKEENKDAYEVAVEEYRTAGENFANELESSSGVKPDTAAMYYYLMSKLKERYDNKEELPQAYNLEAFNNALLRAANSTGTKKADLKDVQYTSDVLLDIMTETLKGKMLNPGELSTAIADHEVTIGSLGDDMQDIIKSDYSPEPGKKKGFLARLFNRQPKEKFDFPFTGIEVGIPETEAEALEQAQNEYDSAKDNRNDKAEAVRKAQEEYDEKMAELMTPEKQAERADLERAVREAEAIRDKTPKRVNRTAIARLEAALRAAEAKLTTIPKVKSTKDIQEKIQALRDELSTTAPRVPDPAKQQDKERRAKEKQEEIDNLAPTYDTAEATRLEGEIGKLDREEEEERRKLIGAETTLRNKTPILDRLKSRFAILEVAKKKMMGIKNLIHITDSRRFSVRGFSGADDLANRVKSDAEKDSKKEEQEER